jgi:four helix bundle protein
MDKPHKKLDVWKLSVDLVVEIYNITKQLHKDETYNLVSQMKRASISIPSNIAEGAARNTKKEFVNFLHIAQGSLSELDTHLEIAERLHLLEKEGMTNIDSIMVRVDKMLTGLMKSQKSPGSLRLTTNVLGSN